MTLIRSEGSGDADLGFYNGVAEQSCKFVDGDGAYLQRTPSSAGNRKMWTTSMWYKRTEIGGSHYLFTNDSGSGNNDITALYFESDQLMTYYDTTGTNPYGAVGPTYFRDTNAWMHIVWAVDAANTEHKVWVNNVLVSTDTGKYPPNYSYNMNNTAIHRIGEAAWGLGSYDIDGYLSHFVHIDGQYLEPDSFAEEKEGVWIPKDTSGLTFGTNGFQLDFKQTGTGTASASTIGADTSGNDHHWTTVGLSSSDSNYPDCPENNWCILNDAYTANDDALSEGNTYFIGTNGSLTTSSFAMPSGKWYCEVRSTVSGNTNTYIGIWPGEKGYVSYPWNFTRSINQAGGGYSSDSNYDSAGTYGTWSSGTVLGLSYDSSNGQFKMYKDDGSGGKTDVGTITESAFIGKDISFAVSNAIATGGCSGFFNFGQDGTFSGNETAQGNTDGNGVGNFFMPVPDGFLALCAKNLAEPTIGPNSATQANDHFEATLYTSGNIGSGGTQNVTNVNFQPDLVWLKNRDSDDTEHTLFDSSRSTGGNNYHIATSNSNAQVGANSQYGYLSAFNSNGFTLTGGSTNANYVNQSTDKYVAYNWKANGGTTTTNDASATGVGSIDSVYQANTTAGFSIVTHTGTGSAGTIAHGLGAKPALMITKGLSSGYHLFVYNHSSGAEKALIMNTDAEEDSYSTTYNDTEPTSTVFSVGTATATNGDGINYINYLFAEVEGFSKFGPYTGNGSANGPFIYTGFRPAWVVTKRTSNTGNWYINDSARSPLNPTDSYGDNLYAEINNGESGNGMDILSNGFKIRNTDASQNTSTATYIYMAFAEMPWKYARAR